MVRNIEAGRATACMAGLRKHPVTDGAIVGTTIR